MKSITEHLKTLPEPYSTLALRRVWMGKGHVQYETLNGALRSMYFPWGKGEEQRFWDQVDDWARRQRKDLPEIPAFLLAELEPAPAAPACVWQIGETYKDGHGGDVVILAIDSRVKEPVVGVVADGTIHTYHLNGAWNTDAKRNSLRDLIPPAPPKRVVPLECADVPPGTVWRNPRGRGAADGAWSAIVCAGVGGACMVNTDDELVSLTWKELMEDGTEILLPGTTVWQKCEKTVDA